jgi:hypothetical protein
MKTSYGFYSRMAESDGCPVFIYEDEQGTKREITIISSHSDGRDYPWPDKVFVCKPVKFVKHKSFAPPIY